jgi:hypothetical protein
MIIKIMDFPYEKSACIKEDEIYFSANYQFDGTRYFTPCRGCREERHLTPGVTGAIPFYPHTGVVRPTLLKTMMYHSHHSLSGVRNLPFSPFPRFRNASNNTPLEKTVIQTHTDLIPSTQIPPSSRTFLVSFPLLTAGQKKNERADFYGGINRAPGMGIKHPADGFEAPAARWFLPG